MTDFNVDRSYSIDWNSVKSALSSFPGFPFQDDDGFSHPLSDGSYSWVMPQIADYGLGYLSTFYDIGVTFPNKKTMGAVYKGFNDADGSTVRTDLAADVLAGEQPLQLEPAIALLTTCHLERL